MIEREVKRWKPRLFLKKISWLVIIISGVLLVIITGFSVYGDNVGDLVVSADNQTARALTLSETGEFGVADSSTFLTAEGIKNVRDSTYYYIPENIREGNGLKSDKQENMYFAYSFYLKNVSEVAVGYVAKFKLDQCTQNIDKALRVMILVDDEPPVIYARPKADGTPEVLEDDIGALKKGYTTKPFTTDEFEVVNQPNIDVDAIQKYTIVMWLEGWDSDCNDGIIGGKLAASITFKILESA